MADLGRFLMRPASYDSGLRFGDPNVRWGNPGYVLEPGDPGFVPPIPLVNKPKTKSFGGFKIISSSDVSKIVDIKTINKETGVSNETTIAMFPDEKEAVRLAFEKLS